MLTMHVAAFAGHEVEQPEVFRLNICGDTAMMHAGRATLQLQGMKQNKVSGSKDLLAKQVSLQVQGRKWDKPRWFSSTVANTLQYYIQTRHAVVSAGC